ncbi:MAG: YqaE/Pmp3 family membrane protein [Halomonas sp.]
MDAREYLARKGLDGDRDAERPTTLEEKSWARAREAGDRRPRAGTPHDWEDWERHHDDLADGAERLQQKINREAHLRLLEHPDPDVAEEHPERKNTNLGRDVGGDAVPSAAAASPEPRTALLLLTLLVPPLAVGLVRQPTKRVWLCLLLTLLGWLPGVLYAWRLVVRRSR